MSIEKILENSFAIYNRFAIYNQFNSDKTKQQNREYYFKMVAEEIKAELFSDGKIERIADRIFVKSELNVYDHDYIFDVDTITKILKEELLK